MSNLNVDVNSRHAVVRSATTHLLRMANAMLLHASIDGMPDQYRQTCDRYAREATEIAAKLRLLELER